MNKKSKRALPELPPLPPLAGVPALPVAALTERLPRPRDGSVGVRDSAPSTRDSHEEEPRGHGAAAGAGQPLQRRRSFVVRLRGSVAGATRGGPARGGGSDSAGAQRMLREAKGPVFCQRIGATLLSQRLYKFMIRRAVRRWSTLVRIQRVKEQHPHVSGGRRRAARVCMISLFRFWVGKEAVAFAYWRHVTAKSTPLALAAMRVQAVVRGFVTRGRLAEVRAGRRALSEVGMNVTPGRTAGDADSDWDAREAAAIAATAATAAVRDLDESWQRTTACLPVMLSTWPSNEQHSKDTVYAHISVVETGVVRPSVSVVAIVPSMQRSFTLELDAAHLQLLRAWRVRNEEFSAANGIAGNTEGLPSASRLLKSLPDMAPEDYFFLVTSLLALPGAPDADPVDVDDFAGDSSVGSSLLLALAADSCLEFPWAVGEAGDAVRDESQEDVDGDVFGLGLSGTAGIGERLRLRVDISAEQERIICGRGTAATGGARLLLAHAVADGVEVSLQSSEGAAPMRPLRLLWGHIKFAYRETLGAHEEGEPTPLDDLSDEAAASVSDIVLRVGKRGCQQLLHSILDTLYAVDIADGVQVAHETDIRIGGMFADTRHRPLLQEGDLPDTVAGDESHVDAAARQEEARRKLEQHLMQQEEWIAERAKWYAHIRPDAGQRSVRVFISSTFNDMHGERDALTRRVFPELNRLLRKRCVVVTPVDLRWGLTAEDTSDAGLGALEHCLLEIDSSRPFFLLLCGERYGWIPPGYRVSDREEFEWVNSFEANHSITAMEIFHGFLRKPFTPVHAWMYERNPSFMADVTEEDERRVFAFDYDDEVVKKRRDNLRETIRAHPYCKTRQYDCEYGGRDGEGKPHVSNLLSFEARVLKDLYDAICSEFPTPPPPPTELQRERAFHEAFVSSRAGDFVGREDLIEALRRYVADSEAETQPFVICGETGIGKSSALCKFAHSLKSRATEHTVVHVVGASPQSTDIHAVATRLCLELSAFCGSVFKPARKDYQAVKDELFRMLAAAGLHSRETGQRFVLLIDGMNQLHETHNASSVDWLPPVLPVGVRVILSTVDSSPSIDALMRRDPSPTMLTLRPLTTKERSQILQDHLAVYRKKLTDDQMEVAINKMEAVKPLYLKTFAEELRLQGQYGMGGAGVADLIRTLPGTVPELLDVTLDRVERDLQAWMTTLSPTPMPCSTLRLFECVSDGMTSVQQAAAWLARLCAHDEDSAADGAAHGRRATARRWSAADTSGPEPDPWEIDAGAVPDHAAAQELGYRLVRLVLCLIDASEHGLSAAELLELLAPPGKPQLPPVVWARLERELELYLDEVGEERLLTFSHQQMCAAVRARYQRDSSATRRAVQLRLVSYYKAKADPSLQGRWDGSSKSAFARLLHHLVTSGSLVVLKDTLSSLAFLRRRIAWGRESLHSLLGGITHAIEIIAGARLNAVKLQLGALNMSRSQLIIWLSEMRAFVSGASEALIAHPEQIFQMAVNQPEGTAPREAALAAVAAGTTEVADMHLLPSTWIRWVNKPSRQRHIADFAAFGSPLTCCAALPRDTLLACGFETGTIKFVDANTGAVVRQTLGTGHRAQVLTLEFTNDARRLASGDDQGDVIVWDPSTGAQLCTVAVAAGSQVSCVRWLQQPPAQQAPIMGTTLSGSARLGTSMGRTRGGKRTSAASAAASGPSEPPARMLAVAAGEAGVFVFVEAATASNAGAAGAIVGEIEYTKVWVNDWMSSPSRSVVFDHTTSALVVSRGDDRLDLWDVASPTLGVVELGCLRQPRGVGLGTSAMAISCDALTLVSACPGPAIVVWSRHTGAGEFSDAGARDYASTWTARVLRDAAHHPDTRITQLVFDPTAGRFLSTGEDLHAFVWDVDEGEPIIRLSGHSQALTDASYFGDGEIVATCALDGTAKLWNVEGTDEDAPAGTVVHAPDDADRPPVAAPRPGRHSGAVRVAAAAAELGIAATGDAHGEIKLWSLEGGNEVAVLYGHVTAVTSLAFSENAATLVSGDQRGAINIWCAAGKVEHMRRIVLDPAEEVSCVAISTIDPQLAESVNARIERLERRRKPHDPPLRYERAEVGPMVMVGTDAGAVHLFRLSDGRRWQPEEGGGIKHSSRVIALHLCYDDRIEADWVETERLDAVRERDRLEAAVELCEDDLDDASVGSDVVPELEPPAAKQRRAQRPRHHNMVMSLSSDSWLYGSDLLTGQLQNEHVCGTSDATEEVDACAFARFSKSAAVRFALASRSVDGVLALCTSEAPDDCSLPLFRKVVSDTADTFDGAAPSHRTQRTTYAGVEQSDDEDDELDHVLHIEIDAAAATASAPGSGGLPGDVSVSGVSFSSAAAMLFSACDDGSLYVHDTTRLDDGPLASWRVSNDPLTCLAAAQPRGSPHSAIVGDSEGAVYVVQLINVDDTTTKAAVGAASTAEGTPAEQSAAGWGWASERVDDAKPSLTGNVHAIEFASGRTSLVWEGSGVVDCDSASAVLELLQVRFNATEAPTAADAALLLERCGLLDETSDTDGEGVEDDDDDEEDGDGSTDEEDNDDGNQDAKDEVEVAPSSAGDVQAGDDLTPPMSAKDRRAIVSAKCADLERLSGSSHSVVWLLAREPSAIVSGAVAAAASTAGLLLVTDPASAAVALSDVPPHAIRSLAVLARDSVQLPGDPWRRDRLPIPEFCTEAVVVDDGLEAATSSILGLAAANVAACAVVVGGGESMNRQLRAVLTLPQSGSIRVVLANSSIDAEHAAGLAAHDVLRVDASDAKTLQTTIEEALQRRK